jgi:uncharacterized protein YndB with AHSA1/START domain
MAQKNELINGAFGKEIIISRIINAPQALVFNVWTDPKHIG